MAVIGKPMWEYSPVPEGSYAISAENRKRMAQMVAEYETAINTPGAYRNATREQLAVYNVAARMAGMLKAAQLF